MMNKPAIAISGVISFLLGIGMVAWIQEWIIIQLPTHSQHITKKSVQTSKSKVTLYYWQRDAWQQETIEILASQDIAETLSTLVSKWLALINEEHISPKKVSLQSVIVTASKQEAYISFDRNPIVKSISTVDSLMWFEGLLKTIREYGVSLQSVYFLAHHQPLQDTHLDFSHAWPIGGFCHTP